MLDKEQLKEKVDEHFYAGTNYCNLKDELVKFIWDYANECWTDGQSWGESHGGD